MNSSISLSLELPLHPLPFSSLHQVQMLPLPVVGGYLGYIGYFCLAAGFEVNDPSTLLQLLDPELALKMSLLAVTALVMIFVHFKVGSCGEMVKDGEGEMDGTFFSEHVTTSVRKNSASVSIC